MTDESALFVPLRSNASALLTGSPIESVRRRLKFASLYFDYVLLEAAIYDVSAGPGGWFGGTSPPMEGEEPRWQTPRRRGAEQRQDFTISVGREQGPGVTPGPMRPAISSAASISWRATLLPFADELPAGADWIGFVGSHDPVGEIRRISDRWKWADERNVALERAIPERFVRNAVIGHANRDLGSAAQAGVAVSVDPLHNQVVAQRFQDPTTWQAVSFAVPILFPRTGELPWEAIAELRRDPEMIRLRRVLREVEEEAAAESAVGDVEAAAHHAYERHLAAASGRVDGLGTVVRKTGASIIFGGGTGAAMLPLPPLLGFAVGTALGGVGSAIGSLRDRAQQKRVKGWVSLAQRMNHSARVVSDSSAAAASSLGVPSSCRGVSLTPWDCRYAATGLSR
jgi:hypothetical protein